MWWMAACCNYTIIERFGFVHIENCEMFRIWLCSHSERKIQNLSLSQRSMQNFAKLYFAFDFFSNASAMPLHLLHSNTFRTTNALVCTFVLSIFLRHIFEKFLFSHEKWLMNNFCHSNKLSTIQNGTETLVNWTKFNCVVEVVRSSIWQIIKFHTITQWKFMDVYAKKVFEKRWIRK